MAKKQKKQEAQTHRELVLTNGDRYVITGETEKYHLCGETQFRKNNPRIARIESVAEAEFREVPEETETPEGEKSEAGEEP